MTRRARRLTSAVIASLVLVGIAWWSAHVYGPELTRRAFRASVDVVAENWVGFAIYWLLSTVVSVYAFHNRNRETTRLKLKEIGVSTACGLVGWLGLFWFQVVVL